MSETSVCSDLLQSLQIFSELGVDSVGDELGPGALADVSLSVQEPLGDVIVFIHSKFSMLTGGLGEDVVNLFDVSLVKLSSSMKKRL